MKKALWVTLGIRGNAGDALIYETTKKLFAGLIDLDFRTVGEPRYIRRNDNEPENVIIGPGGILARTNSARHVQRRFHQEWPHFENSDLFIWSSGILQQPLIHEIPILRQILAKASRIVVRASKEAELIRSIAPEAVPIVLPCTSLFTDKLLAVEPNRSDVVVVNVDASLFNENNIRNHPLKRFKAYAESEGLDVRGMANAYGDFNRYTLDLFPLTQVDQEVFGDFLARELNSKEFYAPFTERLQHVRSFGERYANARFAFGKRLHGWLPFLAFDTPAAFIGMPARRGMPRDYFGSDELLCAVPRKHSMTTDQLDVMADMMIDKLRFFIKHEERLSRQIAADRTRLWNQLQTQAVDFADVLSASSPPGRRRSWYQNRRPWRRQ